MTCLPRCARSPSGEKSAKCLLRILDSVACGNLIQLEEQLLVVNRELFGKDDMDMRLLSVQDQLQSKSSSSSAAEQDNAF